MERTLLQTGDRPKVRTQVPPKKRTLGLKGETGICGLPGKEEGSAREKKQRENVGG